MTPLEVLGEVDGILDETKTALLATLDVHGRPHLRWMTPRRLRDRPNHLYAVTELGAAKVAELRREPRVTWMIQRASLDVVITVDGHAIVLEEPALLNDFLEAAGKDLFMLWQLHPARERPQLVLVETAIEEISRFHAATGRTTSVRLAGATPPSKP